LITDEKEGEKERNHLPPILNRKPRTIKISQTTRRGLVTEKGEEASREGRGGSVPSPSPCKERKAPTALVSWEKIGRGNGGLLEPVKKGGRVIRGSVDVGEKRGQRNDVTLPVTGKGGTKESCPSPDKRLGGE